MSLPSKPQRYRLMLSGVVQGVGLRPFIYNQAKALALCGFVANDGSGVLIEVEGDLIGMQTFVALLKNSAPPLAFIEHLEVTTITPLGCDEFIIKTSRHNSVQTLISPDIAVCDQCIKEFHDPQNRRYHYPFINCTDCGPRFSTLHSLPFDRHHTAMHAFKPCKKCLYEYEDPDDRRFHAQTISCPDCGPKITLRDHQGRHLADENEAIDMVCRMIEDGSIVAVKGWGGFHILCDANNDDAVSKLRRKKRRPSKPLAVMFPDMRSVKKHTLLTPKEEQLLTSKEHPILLVKAKSTMPISKKVTCGITKVGLFLPYTPLHHRILKKLQRPVVATSANISEEPILTKEQEVLQRLSHLVSAVLSHDLPIINACDDSVMMIAHDHPMTLRAARGIAPYSFTLPHTNTKNILAVGGHHKSSIAFSVGSHLIVSPHIGDLDSLETFAYWKRTLKRLSQLYNFKMDLIVHDQHPAYETTKWALDQKSGTLSVQHHYAHALSCMAEYQLQTKVLAFCFDGTGYGNIQNSNISGADTIAPLKILGSEIMIADTHNYERLMNLKPFRLLGGETAIKEPRRSALALLFETFTFDEILEMDLPTLKNFTDDEIKTLHHMWKQGINAPKASSMGRLFDAVASLSDLCHISEYEGQSGLLIESAIKELDSRFDYNMNFTKGEIDICSFIHELFRHEPQERPKVFMQMLIYLITSVARQYAHLPVVLSGGVFQNQLLVTRLIQEFKRLGIKYYISSKVPVNDGGIALGQLYHALCRPTHD